EENNTPQPQTDSQQPDQPSIDQQSTTQTEQKQSSSKKPLYMIAIAVCLLGALGVTGYLVYQYYTKIQQKIALYETEEECIPHSPVNECIEVACENGYDGSSDGCIGTYKGWRPITGHLAN
ncbi:hypothetical protein ACFL1P_01460, partial [Patescibacteria group bacterium]